MLKMFTTEQTRLQFYKELRELMSRKFADLQDMYVDSHMGFCGHIEKLLHQDPQFREAIDNNDWEFVDENDVYDQFTFEKLLPELYHKKPEITHNNHYWFPSDQQGRVLRLQVLDEVISEMESETK